ncbi:MAG: DNRLRE domain-containing protein [Anaerolineae bacterium]
MMKRLLLSILVVGLGLLLTGAVLAEEGGAAGPDVFVRITQPEVNFNAQNLSVAASTSACNATDVTYIHWDLGDIPTTGFVHTATLTLTANYATGTDGVRLGLYETESTWQEETLTWATSPALGALLETRPAPTTSGQVVIFDSAALRNYLNSKIRSGAGQASFALRFTEGCSLFALARFDDRESGLTGPAMHLEYEIYVPDLTIHKSGPVTASPGDLIEYTLVYSNTGNALAPYVTITDALPRQTTVYDHSGTVILPIPDQTLTWEAFNLAPGDSGTLTFTALISPTFTGLLTNTATITTTAVESNTTNNTSPPVVTEVRAPDLTIHKDGPTMAYPGDVITYTLVYSNAGNAPAPYVTITDVLPPQLTALDHTGTILLPLPSQTLTWEVYNLAPGDGGVLTITAIVSSTFTGPLTNTATIATTIFDSDAGNNTSPSVVTEVRAPDLTIHKTGPAMAYPGDVITYTLAYTNVGDALAPYVTVTDLLPLNTQLYGHSGTVLLPMPDDSLTWEVFNLAPGASGTLTVSVVISPTFTGWITNTVTIATTAPEAVVGNNASAVSTQVVSLPVVWYYLHLPIVMRAAP